MDNKTLATPITGPMRLALLDRSNPVFACYLVWMSLLVLKMLCMSLLTARQRMRTKTFANPEDLRLPKLSEVRFGDAHVERVRRAHRNDLENVLPFMLMSLAYVATGPHPMVARLVIRIGASARVLHTMVYAFVPVPQPARALAFFTTFLITCFEAIYVLVCCIKYI
ncbi:GL15177 [Drosophila persimilis]|uniref:Microsomal glutathione S-transferase 1 n=1 Tax=Drosophila persimilis TaxID=7234 RepID=B4H3N0_DROPE|nr:microsomal glutathione S-transferase 1 [Drosophila persimilis]EDW30981.1 GL15177 [Drosophila persimilis]